MKYIIYLIIFIFNFSLVYSQNYFELLIGEENNPETAFGIIQCSDSSFIICGVRDYIDDDADSYLIKISNTGKILKEKSTSIADTSISAVDILTLEDNRHLVLSTLKSTENYDEDNYIVLTQIDDNLNTLSEKRIKFPVDTMRIQFIDMKQANENEIVCFGKCLKDNTNYWYSFIFKVSLDGEALLLTKVEDWGVDDLEIYNSEKIYSRKILFYS